LTPDPFGTVADAGRFDPKAVGTSELADAGRSGTRVRVPKWSAPRICWNEFGQPICGWGLICCSGLTARPAHAKRLADVPPPLARQAIEKSPSKKELPRSLY